MSGARRPAAEPASERGRLAAEVRELTAGGQDELARERFGELVEHHQRRASRLAYYYLRDTADADEAVQDAFLKAYVALDRFDPGVPFEVWFTRILVNGCLDRLKARRRRSRWMHDPIGDARGAGSPPEPGATDPTPEDALLRAEAGQSVRDAISVLPDRQRSVVMLTQLDGRTTAEVSEILGLSESTVRVHLFRAMRRLRQSMGRLAAATTSGRAHDR